jgi:lysophospholipase L1-like esterase
MRHTPLITIIVFFLSCVCPMRGEPPADLPLAEAVECRPRAGLPNFFAKLERRGSVKVGYLGGSITAQEGWRPKSLAHFQKLYPKAKLEEINAAIGGTGSDLGVYRVKQDVLDHQPDLLFVEFAVNDGTAPPQQIYRCMEGIVRQTWRALPECDICFVYTITEAMIGPLLEGKSPKSASAMEKVADHYRIPSVQLTMEVAKLAKEGRLIWSAPLPKTDEERKTLGDQVIFAPDGVHPHPETGHELYLQAIVRSLDPIKAASKTVGPHGLKEPFIASNYEEAKLLPITGATLSSGFVLLDREKDSMARTFANRIATLHRSKQPGDTIAFRFKGTDCAIYDIIGPDCGQVIVTLDDRPPQVIPRFDAYCTYPRLSKLVIGAGLPDVVHTVKIEIHPKQPDKAKILAQRNQKIDKPERYDATAFYPGAILLVGDLVK